MSEADSRLEELERKVYACRRSVQRNRAALLMVALGMTALWIGGTGAPSRGLDDIKAKSLTLVDDKGRERLSLSLIANQPTLWLMDDTGRPRVWLGLDGIDMPSLSFSDFNAKERLSMSLGASGSLTLSVRDTMGRERVSLDSDGQGMPALLLSDGTNTRLSLALERDGSPRVQVMDSEGTTRASIGTISTETPGGAKTTYPESAILLFGKDGKVLWRSPGVP